MRRAALSLILALGLSTGPFAGSATAQDQTLADIRQELSVLFVELQQLKRELSTTGGVGTQVGGDVLQRVDLIEAALQHLTAKTEDLEFRVGRVVKDGTNRIGDLEFRICELEPECDVATLDPTATLGGDAAAAVVPSVVQPRDDAGDSAELAVGERADFDRASAALEAGDNRAAADQFETFTKTYPGSPLSAQAHFLRGEALAGLEDISGAARAYLNAFSTSPDGPQAAKALYRLGTSLGELGQVSEACVTLSEVGARFPGSAESGEAEQERQSLGCS